MDVWLHPDDDVDDDVDDDAEDPVSEESRWIDAGILKGLVVYNPLGILYDPERPAVGRRGIRVGSPLRHLLEAYGVGLEDAAYGDSRCGSQMGSAASTSSSGSRTVTITHSGTGGRSS